MWVGSMELWYSGKEGVSQDDYLGLSMGSMYEVKRVNEPPL